MKKQRTIKTKKYYEEHIELVDDILLQGTKKAQKEAKEILASSTDKELKELAQEQQKAKPSIQTLIGDAKAIIRARKVALMQNTVTKALE